MKRIILLAAGWLVFACSSYAQTKKNENVKSNSREVIIIKTDGKEKKLTVETKDGEVFINGKPSSEYKDDDINIIRQKSGNGKNFLYAPENFSVHDNTGFLGVTTMQADGGAKITGVSKESPAEKAGLKEGDIITKVGDKNISNQDDLYEAVSKHKPKEVVSITYKRDGKQQEVNATLDERKLMKSFSYNIKTFGDSDFNLKMPGLPNLPVQPFTFFRERGRVGLSIEDTENDSGVKVMSVNKDSPADKAGIKENDIITEINGNKVKNVNETRRELQGSRDKSSYNIKIKRSGSEMNFEIKIPKKLNKADL